MMQISRYIVPAVLSALLVGAFALCIIGIVWAQPLALGASAFLVTTALLVLYDPGRSSASLNAMHVHSQGERISNAPVKSIPDAYADASWRRAILEHKQSARGAVYVLRDADVTGFCKIGKTRHVKHRIDTFDVKLPFAVHVLHVIPCEDASQFEALLHRHFAHKRVRGEWFRLDNDDIQWIRGLQAQELAGDG